MSAWQIVRLQRTHDRSEFDCGHAALNDWLKHRARQWDMKDLARTYVAVSDSSMRVAGYYAISNHQVRYEALAEEHSQGLPHIDIPVVLLSRLAVDKSAQGQRLGELLLIDALRRAQHVAEAVGIRAVEVDAIDDAAKQFYLKYGFVPLADDDRHLFLPLTVIRKLKLPPL